MFTRALTDNSVSVQTLVMKVLETLEDRQLGKPIERQEVRNVQTIIFNGLDPSKFPARETPKPAVARPVLPKEVSGTVVPPTAVDASPIDPADVEEA